MDVTRPLDDQDVDLLEIATHGNMNWSGERFSMTDVMSDPSAAHYARFHSERGDFGFVRELEGNAVGVAWALFLPGNDRGYGFVSDQTPELSVWVHEGHRGTGVGRDLIRRLLEEASHRDVHSVSLSVEEGNPAKRLYVREGFVDMPGRRAAGVMLWRRPSA